MSYTETVSNHKAILSKLLCSENVTVEFQNVTTAHFNLKDRTLVLPNFKTGLPNCLYNLFIGHECGHALETPIIEWETLIKNKIVSHTILNIVEDIRIEKIIKHKYPGIRKDFHEGYKELLRRDFFGIRYKDINKMNFLDRLNVHTKCDTLVEIFFSQEEQVFVDACKNADKWEEVVKLTKDIYAFMKANKKTTSDKDKKPKKSGSAKLPPPDDMLSDVLDDSPKEDEPDDDIISETHDDMEKLAKSLQDLTKNEIVNSYVPVSVKTKDMIIPYSTLFYDMNLSVIKYIKAVAGKGPLYDSYLSRHKDAVDFLAKEFQLKRKAIEFQKTQINKTGILNEKRLFAHPFSDDIFRSYEVTKTGQSHGMVLILDWSGSMTHDMRYTIQQLFCLTDFCRISNIPFEVYCFVSDSYRSTSYYNTTAPRDNEFVIDSDFSLVNILSSKMRKNLYIEMQKLLLVVIEENLYTEVPRFAMGSTPLNEAIVATMDIVPSFQKEYSLQNVSVVFLTDGEGTNLGTRQRIYGGTEYIHDPITKNSYKVTKENSQKSILLQILKERTGANVIGFFIDSSNDSTKDIIQKYTPKFSNRDMSVHTETFDNQYYLDIAMLGYDKFFVLNQKGFLPGSTPGAPSNNTSMVIDNMIQMKVRKLKARAMLHKFIQIIS